MEQNTYGRGLDALLNRHKDNKKRIDTLKLYRDSVNQAMSDGIFTQDEQEMLEHLGNSLGIPEEEQDIIIGEVLSETGAREGEREPPIVGMTQPVPDDGTAPPPAAPAPLDAVSPALGYGAMKLENELKNLKIERDALAEEIKLLKQDEEHLNQQILEMAEKIQNRNKEIKILRMENENLKKEFMGM